MNSIELRTATAVALAGAILFSGCAADLDEIARRPAAKDVGPVALASGLRRASALLCDRLPSVAAARAVLEGGNAEAYAAYRGRVDALLSEECLTGPMVRYHQDLMELGSDDPEDDSNRAANLGAYVVVNGLPYGRILTASFCVDRGEDGSLNRTESGCVPSGPVSGILTDPELLKKYDGAFQFKRMNFFSTRFVAQPYPDPADPGLTSAQLPRSAADDNAGGRQPVDFRKSEPLDCVSCHSALNNRVGVFWYYDEDGEFQEEPSAKDPLGNTLRDFQALKLNGPRFYYYGAPISGVSDLGREMARNAKFHRATAKHFMNYLLGRPRDGELPESVVQKYAGVLKANQGNVKAMMREFLLSADYLAQSR